MYCPSFPFFDGFDSCQKEDKVRVLLRTPETTYRNEKRVHWFHVLQVISRHPNFSDQKFRFNLPSRDLSSVSEPPAPSHAGSESRRLRVTREITSYASTVDASFQQRVQGCVWIWTSKHMSTLVISTLPVRWVVRPSGLYEESTRERRRVSA